MAQISQSSNAELRQNALAVLCEELRNPYSSAGVVQAGVVSILNGLSLKPNDTGTREAATKALSALSIDSNGRSSMIESGTALATLPCLSDSSSVVRSNAYDCLQSLSTLSSSGVTALVAAGYSEVCVTKSGDEEEELRHLPLQLLYNCIKNEEGLAAALSAGAVETCIQNLARTLPSLVKTHAAATLGFLCFADSAKVAAIQGDAVPMLAELLDDDYWKVRASAAGALMSIIQTDAGKKALNTAPNCVAKLITLLKDPNLSVKLNVLKTIACAAVHPEARREMRDSSDCLPVIHQIMDDSSGGGEEAFLGKHAEIAREAVLWKP